MKHNFLQPSRKSDRTLLRAALILMLALASLIALGASFGPCKESKGVAVKFFNY